MLETEQNERQYGAPELKTERRHREAGSSLERQPRAVDIAFDTNDLVAVKLYRAREIDSMTLPVPAPVGDLDLLTLEDFEALYADERQMLAYRSLMGEQLTPRQQVRLAVLNRTLERLRPRREPLPEAVLDRVDEILRTRTR